MGGTFAGRTRDFRDRVTMSPEKQSRSVQCRWVAAGALWAAASLVLFGGLILAASAARAEPYMAVRDGYKCSQCHVNKTGGGARTDYGTVYMQTRLASGGSGETDAGPRTDAGQGRVGPNLATSPSVTVGADLRTSVLYAKFDHAPATTSFNRPASCESCHASTPNGAGQGGGGKIGEAYLRLQPIADVATIVYSTSLVPNAATRDFYGLIETLPLDGYVKAGTFKLPNGLQNTWDYPFQHASKGAGYQGLMGFESMYETGVEFGIEPGPLSLALSVTNPDNMQKSPSDKRYFLTGSLVGRIGLIGFNYAQDPVTTKLTRTLTSGFIGASVGRFTLLGHSDWLEDNDSATNTKNTQQAGLAEVDFLIRRGHNLKYVVESRDPSLSHPSDVRDRQSLIYEPFLTTYLQMRFGYRKYSGLSAQTNDNNGEQWFVEGHFVF